jgi:alkylated DNA repair dioxygenase AlkB
MKPNVLLFENFVSDASELFRFCTSKIAWDSTMNARQTASFGVPYNYSQMSYPASPIPTPLQKLMDDLEEKLPFHPNNCLANFYPDGGAKMGFHFDSLENLVEGTGVAIVSLGASRPLTFRSRKDKSVEDAVEMASGSLLYMPPEVQNEWLHGLLKSEEEVGARISLTFRQMVE